MSETGLSTNLLHKKIVKGHFVILIGAESVAHSVLPAYFINTLQE